MQGVGQLAAYNLHLLLNEFIFILQPLAAMS